jgi:UDP-N-acetylmuramate--alanine ligase
MDFKDIKSGLERFRGVFRRFQPKYEQNDILVIDDYAHHPTEVQATIQAARKPDGKNAELWPYFSRTSIREPSRSTRSSASPFLMPKCWYVTDVYPSREKPIEGVTGKLIADTAKTYGHRDVHYIRKTNETAGIAWMKLSKRAIL